VKAVVIMIAAIKTRSQQTSKRMQHHPERQCRSRSVPARKKRCVTKIISTRTSRQNRQRHHQAERHRRPERVRMVASAMPLVDKEKRAVGTPFTLRRPKRAGA